jgi:dTDP-4-dehydrorhamnose 3,5-epimerase
MEIEGTSLPGVLLLKPRVFTDTRGFFAETWSAHRYAAMGAPAAFVQDNISRSQRGVLRGLHIQHPFGQGKLVSALAGELYDVVVDLRVGSPTFGRWSGFTLSGETLHQLYIPPGFAHGFCALQDGTIFSYKCTEAYHPEAEFGIRFDDPDLGIRWPLDTPVVSEKDGRFPYLREIARERLPRFG